VLDNFEQVLAAGPIVADILRRCPNVTFIVTTRSALRISGSRSSRFPGCRLRRHLRLPRWSA
jgi:hypothetical protein